MRVVADPSGSFHLESEKVTLRHATPVINGAVLEDFHVEQIVVDPEEGRESRLELRYTAPQLVESVFIVQVFCSGDHCSWLRYWIENIHPEEISSFGLRFGQIENLRSYLVNGYTSWDGTFYADVEGLKAIGPDAQRPEHGFAMTQLLPQYGKGGVVLGFDRHERFQQEFHFDTRVTPPAPPILTDWDLRRPDPEQPRTCASERLLLIEEEGVEEGLKEWARQVAACAAVPPRASQPPITGWCSWYNLYTYISDEIILDHLNAARDVAGREQLPMRVFQIDDGFTPEMGDWLEIKPQFQRGMKPLMDDIRSAGFIPGLWIGPFLVGNRSRLYKEHPDWVYTERATGKPLPIWKMYGEYRWHKRSEEYYCLDASHPDAFEYLRRVFRTWRKEWGCDYFKTDFMFFGANYGPDQVNYHTPGMTRIEIWRRLAEMIRAELGADATWLGCGCPLWASIGLVDGIRIGGDVGVSWTGGLSAESLLRDQTTRTFANHILWQIDPDCVLLRHDYHSLTDTEVQSLAIFAGMSGGVMMTSDKMDELSAERIRLWRLMLPEERRSCSHPFLGQARLHYQLSPNFDPMMPRGGRYEPQASDAVLVQTRQGEPLSAVFALNTGSSAVERNYLLADLGFHGPMHIYDWTASQAWAQPVDVTIAFA